MRPAIDTNLLVRVLTRDDAAQHQAATALIAEAGCLIQSSVLLETEWVLRSVHRYKPTEIAAAFEALLQTDRIEIEEPHRLSMTLQALDAGIDFTDAFHLAGAQEADGFATFDEELRRRAPRRFAKPAVFTPPPIAPSEASPP